jgi:hypothetical protein
VMWGSSEARSAASVPPFASRFEPRRLRPLNPIIKTLRVAVTRDGRAQPI